MPSYTARAVVIHHFFCIKQVSRTAMCRSDLSRVFELHDLIAQPAGVDAYFQSFVSSLQQFPEKKLLWLARENEFQRLDQAAWSFLKEEALPYLTSRQPKRDWEQLVSTLNLARAYCYLLGIGCTNIRFIPRASQSGTKTPDVEGILVSTKILCEVKTIHCSDDEISRRKGSGVGTTHDFIEEVLLQKIHSTLTTADQQLCAFDSSNTARHIAFAILNFDDSFAEYKTNYYRQIDGHLGEHKIPNLKVVFFNQRTPVPANIVMSHAEVVNELHG